MSESVHMLQTTDVYDFYGCAFLHGISKRQVTVDELDEIQDRLREIHGMYVTACKARIKAEAKFLGVELEPGFSMRSFLDKLPDLVQKDMENEADNLMRGGSFNLMGSILKAHQMAGGDLSGIDTERFGVGRPVKPKPKEISEEMFKGERGGRIWEDPKWAMIAKAYLAVEEATTPDQIVDSIDHLNNLQHNSFHLLIDLQTGRMLEGRAEGATDHSKAVNVVHEVLEFSAKKDPTRLAGKCSERIGSIVKKYRNF